MYLGLLNLQNWRHIATYLEHYWEFEAHILQFSSTIQQYKTVEYERHRTIGDGDRPHCIPDHQNFSEAMPHVHNTDTSGYNEGKKLNVGYLHHQWSDGAHMVRFQN